MADRACPKRFEGDMKMMRKNEMRSQPGLMTP